METLLSTTENPPFVLFLPDSSSKSLQKFFASIQKKIGKNEKNVNSNCTKGCNDLKNIADPVTPDEFIGVPEETEKLNEKELVNTKYFDLMRRS